MNDGWENELKKELMEEITAVDFPEEVQGQILAGVHQQIRKRRRTMKRGKRYTGVLLAAALVVIGTVTAIGAGKVAFYSSHHSINDEISDFAELTAQAQGELGESLHFPENLSENISFTQGIVLWVDAKDGEGNTVETFPQMMAYYQDKEGKDKAITLSVSKNVNDAEKEKAADQEEVYQEITLSGTAEAYLFLPPDQQPSEEDVLLEAEGKLMISYGSSEEERKVFSSVSWYDGGLRYLVHTFEDVELSELMDMAKMVIDSGK